MLVLRVPFAFRWMMSFLTGTALLGGILWLLGFDLVTSSGWQVGVYYLMPLFLLLASLGLVAPNGFRRMRGFGWAMAMLLPAILVSVLAVGWLYAGAYGGYRDPRLFILTVVSIAAFGLIHLFFLGLVLFIRVFLDYVYPGFARRLGSPEPGPLDQGERPGEHCGKSEGA